jgi:hypothetical protein
MPCCLCSPTLPLLLICAHFLGLFLQCYDDYLKTTIDTFTLTKPRNWRPVPPATAAAIFQGLQPLPTDQLPIGASPG